MRTSYSRLQEDRIRARITIYNPNKQRVLPLAIREQNGGRGFCNAQAHGYT